MADISSLAIKPPPGGQPGGQPGAKPAAAPTETEEKNTWGWIKWLGAAAAGRYWGKVKDGVMKPVLDKVDKYTVESAVNAVKSPAGIGVTSGAAVWGTLDANVAIVGASRGRAIVDDAARASLGQAPATRTLFLRLPVF